MQSLISKTLFTILLCACLTAFAATPQTHLHEIEQKISNMRHSITSNKTQQSQLQTSLRSLEIRISKQTSQLHQLYHKINRLQKILHRLKLKYAEYQQQIRHTKSKMASLLRMEYRLGHEPRLSVLLSSNNMTHTQIHLSYLEYLEKDRLTALQTLKQLLALEQANINKQTKNMHTLKKTQLAEQKTLNQLNQLHKQRQQLLNKIQATLSQQTSTLKTLTANKHHLEAVITALQEKAPYFKAIGKPFSSLKHHLPWPTHGRLIPLFGTQIDKSQLRWNGILFKAAAGQPVHAVADGKVVFANWMPGYGLLLIIYHGQDYMTLYGRNQAIFKGVGDTVHAGDEIALVGNTGGYKNSSLYFELRHHSKPINPHTWLKSHF